MRSLLLLVLAAAAAFVTVPDRDAHARAAETFLESYRPPPRAGGITIGDVIDYMRGAAVGQGRYESFYVVSKYSVDMPGSDFLECYGAFTVVRCSVASSSS